MRNNSTPLTRDEVAVLEVLVNIGDSERLSALAKMLSVEVAQPAVASLYQRGLIEIDRIEKLPEGQTRDAPVSQLTPTVRSSSDLVVTTLSEEEAARVIAHPASWIESVIPTWFRGEPSS
ncbi:MAG TPA: hypothetical protein VFA97_01710 [Gaiellaceae bacterium]|nr:hypothetical protein [Gaiellaceae bacterium]